MSNAYKILCLPFGANTILIIDSRGGRITAGDISGRFTTEGAHVARVHRAMVEAQDEEHSAMIIIHGLVALTSLSLGIIIGMLLA